MPRTLAAIKVTIGQDGSGARYPEFNRLPAVQQSGKDWAYYVDQEGLSWHYDHCCGHKTATSDSPYGTQFGVLIIPEDFAIQAVNTFPGIVVRLTEAELEAFYDTHGHGHENEVNIDNDVLWGLQLVEARGINLSADQLKALDPDDRRPGITKNTRRFWKDFKAEVDVEIR